MKKVELKKVIENMTSGESFEIKGNLIQDTRLPFSFGLQSIDFLGTEVIIFGDTAAAMTMTFNLQFDNVNQVVDKIVKFILENDVVFANCILEQI